MNSISTPRLPATNFCGGEVPRSKISLSTLGITAGHPISKGGEKWVKELDYIYLAFGSVGILAAVNRLPFVTGAITGRDLIAPILLTTAIVIRFIKTRADIGQWNKLDLGAS